VATASHDVAVVGGGIVGAACAFMLSERGLDVLLIDRGEPQRAASWGNAGHFAYVVDQRLAEEFAQYHN